jgi:hypothetical protein
MMLSQGTVGGVRHGTSQPWGANATMWNMAAEASPDIGAVVLF